MLLPLVPFAITELGGTISNYAFALAGYGLARLVSVPSIGYLSDRMQPERLVSTSSGLAAILAILAGAFPSLAGLYAAFLAFGFTSGRGSPLRVMALRNAPAEREEAMLSRLSAAGPIGFAIGPFLLVAVTSAAAAPVDRMGLCLMGIGLANAMLLVIFAYRQTRETHHERDVEAPMAFRHLRRDIFRPLMAAWVAFFAQSVLVTFFAVFVHTRMGWGSREIALLIAAGTLIAGASRLALVPVLLRRIGLGKSASLAGLAAASGFAFLALADRAAWIVGSFAYATLAISVLTTVPTIAAHQAVPQGRKGMAFGLVQAAAGMGTIMGSAAVGVLAAISDGASPFWLCAAILCGHALFGCSRQGVILQAGGEAGRGP
jgi:predicted MFS family arabinose efflux permease